MAEVNNTQIPKWMDDKFEELGFDWMPCNWANAMWENDDMVVVECIVLVDAEKQYFRLFATNSGVLEDGGNMVYVHSFVKDENEIEEFIKKIKLKFAE